MDTRNWVRLATGLGSLALARAVIRRKRHFELRGRVAVVTGGSRGLGLVLARELLRRGARVAICARDRSEVERARLDLLGIGGRVHAAVCDLTDREELTRFLAEVQSKLGEIDVLINNAGVIQVGPMELMKLEDYEAAMRLHFWAPLQATLAVLPQMRRRRTGRIVNVASIGARVPLPHLLPYTATKFALYGLSTGLRAELAKDGILVTTVCPGLMRTGSPRHALIKGRHEEEYALFKLTDSLPGITMGAERAARQILRACERGDAEVVLSLPGKLLARAYALSPSLIQDLLGVLTQVLPRPLGASKRTVEGRDTATERAPSIFTVLGDAAARRNNEA